MNTFTQEFFTTTTAEDQKNYFSGHSQLLPERFPQESNQIPSGEYRVVDGDFFRIVSGVPAKEVRERIKECLNR